MPRWSLAVYDLLSSDNSQVFDFCGGPYRKDIRGRGGSVF